MSNFIAQSSFLKMMMGMMMNGCMKMQTNYKVTLTLVVANSIPIRCYTFSACSFKDGPIDDE